VSARAIRLQPVPGDVRLARAFCATAAGEAYGPDCDDLIDDAEMVASELVTNAIRAGAIWIELEVQTDGGALRIAVVDDAPGEVTPRLPRAFDTNGRGLHIVGAIARQWGVEALSAGKRVWAELPLPELASQELTDVAS